MKFRYILLSILVISCSKEKAAFDTMSYSPNNPYSTWSEDNKSVAITSQFCKPLLPKDFTNEKLTLAELIDIALINSPDTKATWAEARSQAAAYGQSLSDYFPEIDLDTTYTRSRTSNVLPGASQTFRNTIITPEAQVSYTIFDFGKRKNSSDAARYSLYYADYTHNRSIQSVIETIMIDYYDYQNQIQQLIALEADLDDATLSFDAANEKFKAGLADVSDVETSKTKYLQTKINLINQKNNLQNSYASLVNDLGLPANTELKIDTIPDKIYNEEILSSVDELIRKAGKQRQDYLAAIANYKSAISSKKYAEAESRPTVDADFDIGKNYYRYHHTENYHYSLEFKVSWPLFKGFFYKNAIKKAKAEVIKAKASLDKKELSMIKDITVAHNNIINASESLKCSKEYLKSAEIRFDVALKSYEAGTMNILDVSTAQSSLSDARAKLASSEKDWYSSVANLAYSTGSLCSVEKKDGCYE